MKLIKSLIFLTSIFAFVATSQAQLLERESVDSKISVGTRPEAGDFGFVVGPSLIEIREFVDNGSNLRGFPLMGVKYYFSENLEFRLTSQVFGTTESIQGNLVNTVGEEDNVQKESFYRFMPSAHYHFSNSNFLDTYVGLGVIIGTEIDEVLTADRVNVTGDFFAERYRQQTFDIGFNLNFGIQAFVADLPLSIGVEASIRSLRRSNLQYEAATRSSVGGVVNEQTFFTRDAGAALEYDALDYSEFEIGSDLRFLVSYYFRR